MGPHMGPPRGPHGLNFNPQGPGPGVQILIPGGTGVPRARPGAPGVQFGKVPLLGLRERHDTGGCDRVRCCGGSLNACYPKWRPLTPQTLRYTAFVTHESEFL